MHDRKKEDQKRTIVGKCRTDFGRMSCIFRFCIFHLLSDIRMVDFIFQFRIFRILTLRKYCFSGPPFPVLHFQRCVSGTPLSIINMSTINTFRHCRQIHWIFKFIGCFYLFIFYNFYQFSVLILFSSNFPSYILLLNYGKIVLKSSQVKSSSL